MKVIFFDSLSGIITGGNGVIKKTSNGGMTWTLIPNNVGDAFYDMKFRDANNGFIVGVSGRILRTSNGGNSWSIVTTFPYSLYGISMIGNFVSVVGSSPGLSYNAHGVSLSSTDTGATWTDDTKFIIRRNFRDVAFTNSQVGSIVGDSGTIFRTTDGGTTWDKQLHGTIFESSGKHFHSVSFINPNIGTVVGDIGTIVKTTNSGTNWILQNSNTTKMLNDVSLFDENKCVVVGEQGLILQTNDGGETWNRRTGETVNELRGVTYVTQSVVVCVGSNGTIVKSSDGGLNWRIISTPTPSTLNDVRFFDEVVGIAVGNNGVILRTTDSGESWLKIDRRAYENLHSITSTGSTGILTGSYGTILRTTDKGETWSNLSIGTLQELRAVTFSDQQSIVIVGTNGLVLSTSEGVVGVGNLSSSNNRPEHFELMQNYPNPFNPLTVIRYQLPVTSHVALKIYNILGQEVAQLVNEILQPGKYQRTWNAKDVASGIYYYKLSANVSSPDMSGLEQSFVEVKKMLYIR
ncbi:MAG: T9SS type A sorting domain-containing protein [Ignavibacteriae bacterium]|nr:T9SS type A sorting domain-containing protein [Ignavibacteriota bacterium]